MNRLIGLLSIATLLTLSVTTSSFAYESPRKYGIQMGGGFGVYDMGDISLGTDYLLGLRPGNSASTADGGPMGNFAVIYRPSRHQMWEIGYNPLFDVENLVENSRGDSSGQILMHANEFYAKAMIVTYPAERLNLNFGLGIGYYNTELQIQDDFTRRFYYDAVGRGWGALGSVGLELGLSERMGLYLGGGGRLVNTTNFTHESSPGVRSAVSVLGGSRPFEVNLTGGYGQLGLRFYFDKVTKPIDFNR
ncbi:MAG: hypothetical protein IPK53_17075 [bacterium]|nr:hypothetical protein [bacterium]